MKKQTKMYTRIFLSKVASWLYRNDYMNETRHEIRAVLDHYELHNLTKIDYEFSDKAKLDIAHAKREMDKEIAKRKARLKRISKRK